MKKILAKAMNLPEAERARLASELMQSLKGSCKSAADRAAKMFETMATVTGRPVEPKMRDSFNAWSRAIIAYSLASEGYSEMTIGRVLSRDHSSVNHMKKNVSHALSYPKMYEDIVERYQNFQTALNA